MENSKHLKPKPHEHPTCATRTARVRDMGRAACHQLEQQGVTSVQKPEKPERNLVSEAEFRIVNNDV